VPFRIASDPAGEGANGGPAAGGVTGLVAGGGAATGGPGVTLGDVVIGVVLLAIQLSGALLLGARGNEPNLTVYGLLLLVAQTLPVIWRRRYPLLVCAFTGVATMIFGIARQPDALLPLGPLVALATVVDLCSRRVAALVALVATTAAMVSILASRDSDAIDVWFALVMVGLAWLLGALQRTRRAYLAEVEARVAQLEQDRRQAEQRAAAEERARLARELHDVVAHHVSMMIVQAEAGASMAAAAVAGADPGTAGAGARAVGGRGAVETTSETAQRSVAAFDAVAGTGRAALTELRHLLGVLREEGDRSPVTPQPGLDDVPGLVEGVRTTGLAVDLRIEGTPRPLPAGLGLSAFRIVQEGLTNVRRHAHATGATVVVRYSEEAVELTVSDDGDGSEPDAAGAGHGLAGLRERVALFGGVMRAGPRLHADGRGYELSARLPIRR
jgi:signal transduction histidine kinase